MRRWLSNSARSPTRWSACWCVSTTTSNVAPFRRSESSSAPKRDSCGPPSIKTRLPPFSISVASPCPTSSILMTTGARVVSPGAASASPLEPSAATQPPRTPRRTNLQRRFTRASRLFELDRLPRVVLRGHHRIALGLELRAGLPLRDCVRLRDADAHLEEHSRVVLRAREIPAGLHLVARLVVVVLSVLVALLHAVVAGLADEVDAGVRVERRHTLFSELEMIGAIVESFFGLRVRPHRSMLCLQHLGEHFVERGVAESDHGEIARLSPLVDPVHVDVRDGLRERVQRVRRIVLRAHQSLFLRRDGQEEDRPARRHRELC